MISATYSGPSLLRTLFCAARYCAAPSPMMIVKGIASAEGGTPSCNCCANLICWGLVFSVSSCRRIWSRTPCFSIKLPVVVAGPPLAKNRPICAFHAQTLIRPINVPLVVGVVEGMGTTATEEASSGVVPASEGRSNDCGTTDDRVSAEGIHPKCARTTYAIPAARTQATIFFNCETFIRLTP